MIVENNQTEDYYERQSRINRERRLSTTPYTGLGKLPPQATDMEEAVLGAIMIQKDAYLGVSEFLKAECFYKDSHQKIFKAISTLFSKGEPIDILKVTQELRSIGELEIIGGAYYITDLTNRVASAANIEYHGRIIQQKFIQRELIRISTEVVNSAYEDTTDVLELLEQNQLALFQLTNFQESKKSKRLGDLIDAEIANQDTPCPSGITGVGTGLIALDTFCSGWQSGELTIIAARPAMGKTAFMMQIARNAAVMFDVPVQVFSLEMTEEQITKRMISNETEVFLEKFNKKTLTAFDRAELDGKLFKLRDANIFIDDTPALSITAFRSKCIAAKKNNDIGLVVIDYLQLMQGDSSKKNGNRDQEIGVITRGMKSVAKELKIPVIALSQLSRASENRPGGSNRPSLKDLRESGNIEQDADNVYFLYRPSYYGIGLDEKGSDINLMAELINAKHRNGVTGSTYFKFRGAVMRFENWVEPENPQFSVTQEKVSRAVNSVLEQKADDEIPF